MSLSDFFLPLTLLAAYLAFVWLLWRETHGLRWDPREPVPVQRPGLTHVPERVLFVCTHNSARSQMAEALLRSAAPTRFVVASAGTAPTHVHPLAMEAMTEKGLSLNGHRAKSLAEVGTGWGYVITVCDAAYERCPEFPAKTSSLHWSVKDPAGVTGSIDGQLEAFRHAREDLSQRIQQWLADRAERL